MTEQSQGNLAKPILSQSMASDIHLQGEPNQDQETSFTTRKHEASVSLWIVSYFPSWAQTSRTRTMAWIIFPIGKNNTPKEEWGTPWKVFYSLLLFSLSVMSDSLAPHRLQRTRLPCPSLSPGVCSNSCPSMPSNQLILCHPLLFMSSVFQGLFPVSWLFTSGGQNIGASVSVSVLPMYIQSWFPLGLTDLLSLKSKGLSRVFTSLQFENINSSVPNLPYVPTLTSVYDYWKKL